MANWKHRKVLVTGAGGFIGGHLVRALLTEGADICITTLTVAPPFRLREYRGQLRHDVLTLPDAAAARDLCESFQPETVFHLAALLPTANASAEEFSQVNVEGTKDMFESAEAIGAAHFVALGSTWEYGPLRSPIREDAEEMPQGDYGKSKYEATRLLQRLSDERTRTTVLRLSTVYGPEQEAGMFIPSCIAACMAHEPFPMSAGEQQLDFIYVADVVRGLLKAGIREEGETFEIVNLGSGKPRALRDVARLVAREFDAEHCLQFGAKPYHPHEPSTRYFSIEKASALLGWYPETPLEKGIMQTIEWYRSHPPLVSAMMDPA